MKTFQNKMTLTLTTLTAILLASSCEMRSASEKNGNSSSLFSLNTNAKGNIAEGGDPTKLCDYLKTNGYFPSNSYAPNTKLLFSSSYEIVDNGAGQAYGIIGADGNFEQQGNVKAAGREITQMLVCPGASNLSGGKCHWKINGNDGYAQLAYDVVCNKRTRGGEPVHPGYTSEEAKLVSYEASTADQKANGNDAVEVTLKGRASTARILFAKGTGLVAVVFQESTSPAGTSEVFIGGTGSGTMGLDN